MQRNFRNTRSLVTYLCTHIFGDTLDFGAGNGKYKQIILPHTKKYIGFDMKAGKDIDVVGDVLNPPFNESSFDTIICTQVLEHVEKPWVVAEHMERILKPGGICIATAPFMVPYHADPYDFFRYTQQGIESLFKNHGFSIVESGRYGNTPAVLAEMIHFSHFSRYTERSKISTWFRDRIMNFVRWIAFKLDPIFKNSTIYASVYVVARKSK